MEDPRRRAIGRAAWWALGSIVVLGVVAGLSLLVMRVVHRYQEVTNAPGIGEPVDALVAGDCYLPSPDETRSVDGSFSTVRVVSCDEAHTGRVFATVPLPANLHLIDDVIPGLCSQAMHDTSAIVPEDAEVTYLVPADLGTARSGDVAPCVFTWPTPTTSDRGPTV